MIYLSMFAIPMWESLISATFLGTVWPPENLLIPE